ncbi:MAG: FecR family protein [Bacteroides sp.]
MEERTKQLLDRYIRCKATRNDWRELKQAARGWSEPEMEQLLADAWSRYDDTLPVPDETHRFLHGLKPQGHRLEWHTWMRIAAILLIPLLSAAMLYLYRQNRQLEQWMDNSLAVVVRSGDKSELTLPDGTRVSLNSSTRLTCDKAFGRAHRDVYLEGEAYLEVAKDASKPFRVHTPHADIEVKGTCFNVRAYSDDDYTETMLMEGSVQLTTERQQRILLQPMQKAIYSHSDGLLKVKPSDGDFETAWLRGELVFRSTDFADLIKTLERYYDVEIEVMGHSPEHDRFTGSFRKESLHAILNILQIHYHFRYAERDGKIIINY